MPEDLLHLTIDDVRTPPAAGRRLEERGPYVITLSASSAPLSIPPKEMLNWDHLRIYQVQREEGGRRRYRLRMGPISSELEADVILASVREHYPAAFKAIADKDDLRAPQAERRAAARTADVRSAAIESSPPPTEPRPAPPTATATAVSTARELHPAAPPTATATAVSAARELHPAPLPAVDSTRTLRALTSEDFAEDRLTKWFAIQLAVGKDAFRPEDVLSLDLFKEFNLYSTIEVDQGQLLHALRLGFFLDRAAAQVVADYLRCYFDAPAIKRVSASERERFAEGRVAARKISEATGVHEVVELSSPPPAPQTTLADLKVTTRRDPDDPLLGPPAHSPWKR